MPLIDTIIALLIIISRRRCSLQNSVVGDDKVKIEKRGDQRGRDWGVGEGVGGANTEYDIGFAHLKHHNRSIRKYKSENNERNECFVTIFFKLQNKAHNRIHKSMVKMRI